MGVGKGITFAAGPVGEAGGATVYRGQLDGAGRRFGIVVSRFNAAWTDALLRGAVSALCAHGVRPEDVEVARVPGAFEIPLVIERWAGSGRFHALIALGCVVEGETPHADLIGRQVTRALSESGIHHACPVIDSVVTARTEAQAAARCTDARDGRGWYAGCAALEMADLLHRLEQARR